MRDAINATSGGSYLLLEAFQSLHGASGVIIDVLKIVMVMVIVTTSTIGALAADSNGDGTPDICTNIKRLLGRGRARRRQRCHKNPSSRRARDSRTHEHEDDE